MAAPENVAFIGENLVRRIVTDALRRCAGLGVMGYGMAINLRMKLEKTQTLYICDTNQDAIDSFRTKVEGQRNDV